MKTRLESYSKMPMVNFYPRDIFLSKVAGLWFQESVLPVGLFTLRHSRRSLEATKKKEASMLRSPQLFFTDNTCDIIHVALSHKRNSLS